MKHNNTYFPRVHKKNVPCNADYYLLSIGSANSYLKQSKGVNSVEYYAHGFCVGFKVAEKCGGIIVDQVCCN